MAYFSASSMKGKQTILEMNSNLMLGVKVMQQSFPEGRYDSDLMRSGLMRLCRALEKTTSLQGKIGTIRAIILKKMEEFEALSPSLVFHKNRINWMIDHYWFILNFIPLKTCQAREDLW